MKNRIEEQIVNLLSDLLLILKTTLIEKQVSCVMLLLSISAFINIYSTIVFIIFDLLYFILVLFLFYLCIWFGFFSFRLLYTWFVCNYPFACPLHLYLLQFFVNVFSFVFSIISSFYLLSILWFFNVRFHLTFLTFFYTFYMHLQNKFLHFFIYLVFHKKIVNKFNNTFY